MAMTFTGTSGKTDLPRLGHAAVTGAGIAGLLAARVLAEHFETVTLVERDTLPNAAEPRKGVPQGNHVHLLLVGGRLIVEALFPGLGDELRAAGAVVLNGGRDLSWHQGGGWRVKHESDLVYLSMTRSLLEATLVARLRALPNLRVLDRTRVGGWLSDGLGRVTGVRVEGCSTLGASGDIKADLVIDAMGRGSATPVWLPGIGFAAPSTELLPTRVAYASCLFRRPEGEAGRRAVVISGNAGARRRSILFPIEGGRWLVTLVGFFGEPMPRDHDSFLAFARSLPVLDVDEAIRGAEPVGGISSYRYAGNFRYRYERLDRFPEGLVVIGDAVCSFNPIYGQGMTVAAFEAELLGKELGRLRHQGGIDPAFGRRWFRSLAPLIDAAWNGVSLEDLRFPELAHHRPTRVLPLQWYMGRVSRATHRSALVANQFYRVINFLDPPARLFRPRVMAQVLLGGLRRRAVDAVRPDGPRTGEIARSGHHPPADARQRV
jgi:2-polyprenyl-6-methoxyphenol hydroxylase-like FAD-dependent oxidoreductase